MKPTFRPTVSIWPAQPPGLPMLWPRPSFPADDSPAGSVALVSVPEDFVLRECADVDLEDDGAVVDFVRQWGSLSPGRERDAAASLPVDGALKWDSDLALGERDSIEAQRTHMTVLQALAGHFVGQSKGDDLAAVWESHGFTVHMPSAPWFLFMEFTNAALRIFPMHVALDGLWGGVNEPAPSTYEAAVLQVATLIAEERQVNLCANERCRRPFTRQRGRAKYADSGHATGVRYCSHLCAKAQSERDRRARRRAESINQGGRS